MMKIKKIATVAMCSLMAVGACLGMAACKEDDPNKITLWAGGQWTGNDAENLKKYITWYNETNELGLTIDLSIQADFEQTFSAAINLNKGPDLMIWDRFNTASYVDAENLEPIDDLIERDGIKATHFNTTAYNEMSYGGVQYGLPLDLDMWGVYVNMDIVNAYNEANPGNKITCFWNADGSAKLDWTWDDLLDTAKKLKGLTYKTFAGNDVTVRSGYDGEDINEFFYHNYVSTGQEFIVNGKPAVNNAYGDALLDYFYKIYNDGTWDSGYVSEGAFVQGQLAMYMRPTYFVSYLNKYANKLNVRFMPQPKYPGEGGVNRGVLGGYGMAIPSPVREKNRTEKWLAKKERCWEFMKDWLYNEDNMIQWAKTSETVPALLSTHTDASVAQHKVLKDAVPFANTYTIRPAVPGWKDVQVNVFNSAIPTFCKGGKNDASARAAVLAQIEKESDDLLSVYA